MKLSFIFLINLFFIFSSFAEVIHDHVYSIEHGKKGEEHLVYLSQGRVVFTSSEKLLPKVGDHVIVETDNKNRIKSLIKKPLKRNQKVHLLERVPVESEATVFSDLTAADEVFKGMNRSYRNFSECTDRAHVWSFEEWKKNNIVMKKVFLFFTNTYIRRYNYDWWFHVSPYTFVQTDQVTEYVMDRRFITTPLLMKDWTDKFIRSKKACPVSTYKHYQENKFGEEHCFAVKSHMFNRLPMHVGEEESTGISRSGFDLGEVGYSYRAFRRRGFYEN